MRYSTSCAWFALLPCLFYIFTPSIASPNLFNAQFSPSLPFQIPHHSRVQDDQSWFTTIRDGIIRRIWGPPLAHPAIHGNCKPTSSKSITPSLPPPALLARYGGDVVLRFQINSAEEAKALAEATNVLFLDVWEFTTEWVDIRLAKDVVCLEFR